MARSTLRESHAAIWRLSRRQHGVVTRRQLLDLGFSPEWVRHRLARGRLHPLHRGVYAVGRPDVAVEGRWMAAVLACGPTAVLSHRSAAALWGIWARGAVVEVSVPAGVVRRPRGVTVYRRATRDAMRHRGIPVTTPVATLIDLATCIDDIEQAIREADKLGLTDPDALRAAVEPGNRRPGARRLRETLDRRTFTITDSRLERLFLPLVRAAGLPKPVTQTKVNGFRVDFHWAELGLVVETDGLTYHRTPAQQAEDRLRDQTHAAAGLTPLRFTRAQVRFEPRHVTQTLAAVAERLRGC